MKYLKYIQLLVLIFLPACSLVKNKTETKYFEFPKPTGKYAVGTMLTELTNKNYLESVKGEPASFRRLQAQTWYPSSLPQSYDGTGPSSLRPSILSLSKDDVTGPAEGIKAKPTSPYTYEMLKGLKKMCEDVCEQENLSKDLCDQFDLIRTYAVSDAKIMSEATRYPVILFEHGYATARGEYTALCEELASQGYIVFMVMHTNVTSITRFADGTETEFVRERSMEMFNDCLDDTEFVLNCLQNGEINEVNFKELTQHCDFENIGIVGHSLGGMMANHVCKQDSRVKAGISLDGPLFGPGATIPPHKPFMFMIASTFYEMFGDDELKQFTEGMTKEEFAKSLDTFCKDNGKDSYKITLKNSEHCTFSDSAVLVNVLKKIFNTDDIDLCVGKIDGTKATKIIRAYIVSFFDKYLKNQQAPLLDDQDKKYAENVEFESWVK